MQRPLPLTLLGAALLGCGDAETKSGDRLPRWDAMSDQKNGLPCYVDHPDDPSAALHGDGERGSADWTLEPQQQSAACVAIDQRVNEL